MDWDRVRVFLAVADGQGLGRAARRLGLSESTVGRQLVALERDLNCLLFERLPNRVELTPVGRRLAEAARRMAEGADSLQRLALAAVAEPGLPVRVSCTTSMAWFLTGHLDRLLAAAADAPLELVNTRATHSLPQREAEIALRMRRPPERGDLVIRRLGRLGFAPYAREGPEPAAVIGLRDDPGSRQARWLADWAGGRPMPLRLGELPLRLAAIRRGLGASLLPCCVGDTTPGLVRLAPPPAELVEDVYLLIHADLRELPQVRRVAQAIAALLREHADLLTGTAQAASRSSATAG